MDPFASVFGQTRSHAHSNDQLTAEQPTEAARRKLEDASRGLGSGIVAGPLKTLHQYSDELDAPLLAELSQRTCRALAQGALKRRRAVHAAAADLIGAHADLSDVCIVNEVEDADGNRGLCMHILPEGADADPFELSGKTVCGKDAANGYIRLPRGAWHAARTGQGIGRSVGHGVLLLQWCNACQAHEDEHADCAESADGYPLFGSGAENRLFDGLTTELGAQLPEKLAEDGFDQPAAFTWSDQGADALAQSLAAQSALQRGTRAVRFALKLAPSEQLEEMLKAQHGVELADALPDAEQWSQIATMAFDASSSRDIDAAQGALNAMVAHICQNAAAKSGKPATPAGFSFGGGLRAEFPQASAPKAPDEDEQSRRERVKRSLGRI